MINEKNRKLLIGVIGFGLFMFTRYHFLTPTIPIAIIIAPIFIIRFLRTIESSKKSVCICLIGFAVSLILGAWVGFFGSIWFSIFGNIWLAIVFAIPYIIDRFLYKKFKGIIQTLIFPISMTAMLFLNSMDGILDGDSVTQVYIIGEMPLLQLASLFGLPGLVFFWSWLATIVNQLWERSFDLTKMKYSFIFYIIFVLLVNLYCFYKNPNIVNDSPSVKVAAVTILDDKPADGMTVLNNLEKQQKSSYEEVMKKVENLVIKATSNDAEIVSFNEFALYIDEDKEVNLHKRLSKISKINNVYLSFSYIKFIDGAKEENRHVLLDNKGLHLLNYQKRFPIGLDFAGEAKYVSKGPEVLQFVDTEYGRIGVTICRDLFSPTYIYQAGKNNVDIILNPSYDTFRAYNHYYEMRGIEYGFSIVRPSKNGISYARDPHGNVISSMDYYATNNGIMYADVPIKGVRTLYSIIGDLFAWITLLLTVAMIIYSIFKRKSSY